LEAGAVRATLDPMNETTAADAAAAPALPAALRLGAVHLTVTDLDRSVAFYQDAIGLQLHSREGEAAAMGAGGEDLIVLHEAPFAREAGRHAGLYHVALLHPSREELARALMRLSDTRTFIEGASDHGISEAIYLPDPDGNGIELAADRPREAWPADWGDLRPQPLDMHGLIRLVASEPPSRQADPGLVVGHLHLHVGDVERGLAFYRDVIGFEVQALLPSAAFVSAGGYHHHLGFNVWRGTGVPPAPPGTVGLREWTVLLPEDDLTALLGRLDAAGVPRDGGLTADPWGNAIRFAAA
jgi:catechol 2,3-dioxygenase